MSLKIAMIGQKGIPAKHGGIERHVEELSIRLAARGHQVTVYTRPYFTSRTRKQHRGVRLVSLSSLHTKHFDAISHTALATLHAIRQGNDIIHFHGVGPSLLAFLPRLFRSKAKVISTFHCLDRKHQKWGFMARQFLRHGEWASVNFPDQTIAVSQTIQRYCRRVFEKTPIYIPNGVARISSSRPRVSILKRFGLERGQYIISVSRLIPHKGIHYLIEAYKQLKTTKKLVIVGDGFYTDAYVQRLKDLAQGDSRIIFTGFRHGDVLASLFAFAGLYVLPSEAEGLPIALLEAASNGICLLASDIPENMEVLDAVSPAIGYSFRNGNVDDLRDRMKYLLSHPRLAERAGQRGKAVVEERFAWDEIVASTEQVYHRAINLPVRVQVEDENLRHPGRVYVSAV